MFVCVCVCVFVCVFVCVSVCTGLHDMCEHECLCVNLCFARQTMEILPDEIFPSGTRTRARCERCVFHRSAH